MLSQVGCGIEPAMEYLPAQITAAVPGNGQKPVVVFLPQGAGPPIIPGEVLWPLSTGQRQARRQQGSIQPRFQGQGNIGEQPHTVGQRAFHRHDDLISSAAAVPGGGLIVQTDQNGGIRSFQLQSTVLAEMFQKIKSFSL